jgi:hypothetical protein
VVILLLQVDERCEQVWCRVQVLGLGASDLLDLLERDRGDLVGVRGAGPLLHTGGLLDELRGRRRLRDEGEGSVLVDGDLDGDDVPTLRLGRGVVRLAELHDVDTVLTERGADRGCRSGCAGLDLKLDVAGDLLLGGHSGP